MNTMRTLLARIMFFVLGSACWPACPCDGQAPPATNNPTTAAIAQRLDSIVIDRFGVPAGPRDAGDIRRQLAYLTVRSRQADPAHLGVTFHLRESPIDPKLPAPPPSVNPPYHPMQSWEYVPLRVLLDYICKANGLSYDIEDGQVILFHPDQKANLL